VPCSNKDELMFVVGCRKWWMNQPDLLPEDQPRICSCEELLKIVELCNPLGKILCIQAEASTGAFGIRIECKRVIGPEKCKPMLNTLGQAFPHLAAAAEPVLAEDPWNSHWEHKVTVHH